MTTRSWHACIIYSDQTTDNLKLENLTKSGIKRMFDSDNINGNSYGMMVSKSD